MLRPVVEAGLEGRGWLRVPTTTPSHPLRSLSGLDHFLYGLSDEMKQVYREQLFTVCHEDLVDVSNR